MTAVLILIAVVLGVSSALQSVTNGVLSGRIGLPATVFINGAIVGAGALLYWWLAPRGAVDAAAPRPWYLYVGGFYGLAIIVGAAFCFPRLGAGPTTAVMVAAMLIAALGLDHAGLPHVQIPVTPIRLWGCVLLIVGAVLVLWPKLFPASDT